MAQFEERHILFIEDIISILDELQGSHDHWQKKKLTAFTYERIRQYREAASSLHQRLLSEDKGRQKQGDVAGAQRKLIYLLIYQANGGNLAIWERILASLSMSALGRPAYAQEEEARKAVQEKEIIENEGYIALWVDDAGHSLSENKDEFDQPLIEVNSNALDVSNLEYFVHANSAYYNYENNTLVRKT
jgi:hypothetical protein